MPKTYRPLSYQISKDGVHWFVSITVEVPDHVDHLPCTGEAIGIDLGVKTLTTISDGKQYRNINKHHKLRRMEKRFKRLQRKASRKYHLNKEGNRYRKTRNLIKLEQRVAKLRSRIDHIQQDFIQQMTTEIVKTKPSHIVMEDLNVKGMLKNRQLARSIWQCNSYEISRQIDGIPPAKPVQLVGDCISS